MKLLIGLPAVASLLLLGAASASATTFCVPTFHPACPNSGGNVAQANLETAMQTSGDDTVPDRIVIAAGTITNPDPYEIFSGDNDNLEIVGAGPAATAITTTGSGNEFVMNLNGARDVTMRDLTIRAPASFTDGQGGGLQAEEDTFVNVDIESRNPGSDGAPSMIGGSTFTDGRLYGSMGGSIGDGFRTNGAGSGEMRIERTSIENASWGVAVDSINVITRVRRTQIIDPVAYGLRVTKGGFAVIENSLIVTDDAIALTAETGTTETVIVTARHVTFVDTGGTENPAIDVGDDLTPKAGTVNAVVSDSIIAGNEEPLKCDSPTSNTTLTMRYSYFFHSASVNGNCSVPTINTIDAFAAAGPPQFAGATDYHLPAGSPAIDSGDPLTATLPTEDFDGAPRPVDGNGDGIVQRDMGAFEYQPPAPPGEQPGTSPTNPLPDGALADFGPKTLATLALARKRIAADEPLRVRIVNRNPFPIQGMLGGWCPKPRPKGFQTLVLRPALRAPFRVGANARKVVALKLYPFLRDLLVRRGGFSCRFRASLKSPAGNVRRISKTLAPKLKSS
jgi:hypothetical protein